MDDVRILAKGRITDLSKGFKIGVHSLCISVANRGWWRMTPSLGAALYATKNWGFPRAYW